MCAKTDVNAFAWNDAEQPRPVHDPEQFPHTPFLVPVTNAVVSPLKPRTYHQLVESVSPLEVRDSLRSEISRGKEYLLQVQNELRQNRELLERWSQYEVTCSLQPLDHLVQAVWLKSKVERFLIGWLDRKQKKLSMVQRKVEAMAANGRLPHVRASRRRSASEVTNRARKSARG